MTTERDTIHLRVPYSDERDLGEKAGDLEEAQLHEPGTCARCDEAHPVEEVEDETEHITGADRYNQKLADRHGVTKQAVQAAQDALSGDSYAALGHLFPGVVTDTEWVLAHQLYKAREALRGIAESRDEEALAAYTTRDERMYPSDYWSGLGTPEDAFAEGRKVGRSEAAAIAQQALIGVPGNRNDLHWWEFYGHPENPVSDDPLEAELAKRVGEDGYIADHWSDHGGWAGVVVKTTKNDDTLARREWLSPDEWFVYEARGENALHEAFKQALNDLYPQEEWS